MPPTFSLILIVSFIVAPFATREIEKIFGVFVSNCAFFFFAGFKRLEKCEISCWNYWPLSLVSSFWRCEINDEINEVSGLGIFKIELLIGFV